MFHYRWCSFGVVRYDMFGVSCNVIQLYVTIVNSVRYIMMLDMVE